MTYAAQEDGGTFYQVLLYHGVYSDDLDLGLRNSSSKHIPKSRFEKEMRTLRDMRPVVTMADIAAAHRGKRSLPDGAVAVTFDDGYHNLYNEAWPILAKYEIPTTIYLATGFIGTGASIWTDRLESAILLTSKPCVAVETRDERRTYDLETSESRIAALGNIKALCKRVPNFAKDRILASICEQLDAPTVEDHPIYRFMDWAHVKEMNESPLIHFGAHTVNHVSLVKVEQDEMRAEIDESLAAVSENLGEPCRHFSYPEGQANDFNTAVVAHLRDCGLDYAPSAIEGTNRLNVTDPFSIHRQMVGFEDRPFPIVESPDFSAIETETPPMKPLTLFGRNLVNEIAVIAEIGVNHEGSVDAAATLVKRAAEAGADAVKFQSYTPSRYISSDDAERFERVIRFGLSEDDHRHLAKVAEDAGIAFFSSALTEDWVPLIAELSSAIKIASGDLNFEPVIRNAARTQKTVVLSTGGGTLEEVRRAIDWVREEQAAENISERLVVMHCVSEYPASIENVNLLSIPHIQNEFGVPVGWSNHVIGPEACLTAVALGASVIEVHVTDQREGKTFHDHMLSFEPAELKDLIDAMRRVRVSLGTFEKTPRKGELEILNKLRKGVVAARDLSAGAVLRREDLIWARPATYIRSDEVGTLVGRTLKTPKAVGSSLKWDDLV